MNNRVTKQDIGKEVFIVKTWVRQGESNEPMVTRITKVGLKYFEVEDNWMGRFMIETLKHDGRGYSSQYEVFLSMEEFTNKELKKNIIGKLKNYFSNYTYNNISLDDLQKVSDIIFKND